MDRGCSRLMFGKPVIHTALILGQLVLGSISGSSDVFQIAEEVTFTGRMPRQKEVSIHVATALSSQSSVGWDSTIPVSRGDPLPLWSPPLDLCPSTVVAVTSWMLLHLPIASLTIASTLCSPAPCHNSPELNWTLLVKQWERVLITSFGNLHYVPHTYTKKKKKIVNGLSATKGSSCTHSKPHNSHILTSSSNPEGKSALSYLYSRCERILNTSPQDVFLTQ